MLHVQEDIRQRNVALVGFRYPVKKDVNEVSIPSSSSEISAAPKIANDLLKLLPTKIYAKISVSKFDNFIEFIQKIKNFKLK